MSTPEVGTPRAGRIRHHVRDGFSVAALSLGASIGTAVVLWAVLRWLA